MTGQIENYLRALYNNEILESEFISLIEREDLYSDAIHFILELFNKGQLNNYLELE